jgi:acyl-CoA reductase-like NAD-dependent aldehyde dehydrogenase
MSTARHSREEAFGPVAILSRFTDFERALDEVNDSKFGLQAGSSPATCSSPSTRGTGSRSGGDRQRRPLLPRRQHALWRVKDSGLGREGVRFAMEDMTEIRNLVIRRGAGAALRQMGE